MTERPATSPSNRTQSQPATFAFSAPQITLPKGGGAIRGIGEKSSANPVTGMGSMSVPISTSPGRSGFGRQLALSNDSGSGNGPLAVGWSRALPSITRKTDKGLPQYRDGEESKVFILSGAEDFVPPAAATERVLSIDKLNEKLPIFTKGRPPANIQRSDIYLFVPSSLSGAAFTVTPSGNEITFSDGPSVGTMRSFVAKDVGSTMDSLEIHIARQQDGN